MSANSVSSVERLTIPLNRNSADGNMDSDSARKRLFFRKRTAQTPQYRIVSAASTIRYSAKASQGN